MLVFRWKIFYFCIDNFPETLAGGEEPLIVATPALVIKASCKQRQYKIKLLVGLDPFDLKFLFKTSFAVVGFLLENFLFFE